MTRIVARLPNESEGYRKIRQELLEAEIALRERTVALAALRRELPLDTEIEDYVFERGPADLERDEPIEQVHLSELFTRPDKPLVVYHFMYGEAQTEPCPMCSIWLDGFNGILRQPAGRPCSGRRGSDPGAAGVRAASRLVQAPAAVERVLDVQGRPADADTRWRSASRDQRLQQSG